MAQAISARGKLAARLARHSTGIIASVLFVAPIVWTVLSAFKPAQEARLPPLPPWPTTGFSLENYQTLNSFGDGLWVSAQNSIYVSVMTVILSVIVSVLAGYGFSRFRFPCKDLFFVLILSTIMIPFQSILTPIFLVLTKLGLHNTLTGLVGVYVTLQLPFSIFMMRNAFDAVPREIEEAALVEGCSRLRVFTRITLPMMRAPLASAALFVFILNWSDYLIALLLTTREWVTIPVYMASLSSSMTGQLYGAKAALGLIAAVPPVIMGIAIQRHLVRGLTFGALKQ
ncbi:MAG: carbohydrate ABC transporter permease [Mesorhizobium sp.]|nr:MAG: carbohydrate ABC transporter permease [Mesorhizobium sp.]